MIISTMYNGNHYLLFNTWKTRSDKYLFHSAPFGRVVSLGRCRSHAWSRVCGAGAVGVSSVRGGHWGDQRLDHPLQIRARRNGCDSGDEGGTWCGQLSEILWAIKQKNHQYIVGILSERGYSFAGWLWMKKGVYKKLAGLKISVCRQLWRDSLSEEFPGEWIKLALHCVQRRSVGCFYVSQPKLKSLKNFVINFHDSNFVKAKMNFTVASSHLRATQNT